MSLYSDFFLNTAPSVAQLDLIEITHLDFSQDYRLVRNHTEGVDVTHEGPAGPFTYQHCPMRVLTVGAGKELDQEVRITLGDVGEIIATEIGNILAANSMIIRPALIYRTYASDDLTQPIFGPLTLQISAVTATKQGAQFTAHAPHANVNRTGVAYEVKQFPTLRGIQ